jgi:translocation and assembly module TamB
MTRRRRRQLKVAAVLASLLALLAITFVLTLRSPWFHEKVRQRIVAELERATGGTATLGDWALDWRLMTLRFKDLTLHGSEPAGAAPLVQASSIEIGLKILSFWKRDVDIASLTVLEPRVNIMVNPDGSTNIPAPRVRRIDGKAVLEPIIDWKIGRIAIENGTVQYAETRHDLSIRGEKLRAQLSYDLTGPRYKGQVSIQPVRLNIRGVAPFDADANLIVGLEKNRISIESAKFDLRGTHVEASGAIENLAEPRAVFQFTTRGAVDEFAHLFRIPEARGGILDLAGSVNYHNSSDYLVTAQANVRGLQVTQGAVRLPIARATSNVRFDPQGMRLRSLVADLLGGRFTGEANLPGLRRFAVDGTVQNISLQQTLNAFGSQLPPAAKTTWSGAVSGPIRLEGGLRDGGPFLATGKVTISPAGGGIPVQGAIDARYDGQSRTLSLGDSYLQTPGARVELAGVLGEQLKVRATSTNLDELLPAINALSNSPVNSLPVHLKSGGASFNGTVSGALASPQIDGALSVTNFEYGGIDFNAFNGQLNLNESWLKLHDATLTRRFAKLELAGTLGLTGWKPTGSSPITATAALSGAEIEELLNLAGQKQIPVRGALTASAKVSGTVDSANAVADVTVTRGVAYDEPFDRLQASVEYSPQLLRVRQFRLTAGPAQISGAVSFEPSRPFRGAPEIRDGRVQFQISTNDIAIQRFQSVKRRRPDISGIVRANLEGSATVHDPGAGRPPEALLTSLNGDVASRDLRLGSRSIGVIKAVARTEASVLKVQIDSNVLNSNLTGSGQWRLVPGYPGEATARFSQISLGLIREWLAEPGTPSGSKLDGSIEGTVSIAGPALEPRAWKASAQLSKLELYPAGQAATGVGGARFVLRNQEPVVLTMERSNLVVSNAHFSGPGSDFRLTGSVAVAPRISMDLRLLGDVNLTALQSFTTDLEVAGAATVNASIRGAPDQPQVNGRVDVRGASLHFPDTPTGLSGGRGTILFTGSQATIQDFTGIVGGGKVSLSGVVAYAGGETSYRIDAVAKDVRVRFPEGLSMSANAELSLRGTSQRSTLSGAITVLRTGFNPRTDFSSILGKASEPVRTPSARIGPLSGMRFDVRIETAPDISFESSLGEDIQVEGNLRLQGTPYNPVLLGRINITQGEINFFGTRYTINSGSITFANPVKLEPVLNVDLETRVSGIDVILTISGPLNNLNVTPRSDPPLDIGQVLALLATGSAPTADATLAIRQNPTTQSFTQLGPSALIGQVVANPVSSRLQRFFGVSSLKIDPQLTGIVSNPQPRVTLQQQVSKEITITYITNLSSTSQQIVRVEWSLNRNWSVIGVRDENGQLGIDFLYKKSFK